MISPLDRKLLRDLGKMKGQVVAVSLVMACGLAMMIMTRNQHGIPITENGLAVVVSSRHDSNLSKVGEIVDLPNMIANL